MNMEEVKQVHAGQWYQFVTSSETFKGRVTSIGGLTAYVIDDATGIKKMVDVSDVRVYTDLTHDGSLEVRFLWSRWALEVKIEKGEIIGYITGQSAHTCTYRFTESVEGGISCRGVPEPPATVEKTLCAMMRKWNRLLTAAKRAA